MQYIPLTNVFEITNTWASGNDVSHPLNGLTTPFVALVSAKWQRFGNIKFGIVSPQEVRTLIYATNTKEGAFDMPLIFRYNTLKDRKPNLWLSAH